MSSPCVAETSPFVLFPFVTKRSGPCQQARASSTHRDIDLGSDLADWAKLSPDERHFISHVLAFFAASDGIVVKTCSSLVRDSAPEAVSCGFQMAMENIHSETHSR